MARTIFIALTWALLINLSIPMESAWGEPKRGGTLTMAIRKDLTMMNPLVRTMSTDQSIRELIYESLLTLDEKGNLKPKLAESWKISKDGKTYTFNLRKGVKYHNGQEMTARDAKFAIDYTLNPKNGAYGRARLTLVKGVEATDKYTLKVSLRDPSTAFLSVLTDIQAFSLIPSESLKEGVAKPDSYPPGTGPFKFVGWKPRQQIVFVRNDNYWGQKPYLDKVVLRPIRNGTVRFTALRSGDVDVVERTPYEWVQQVLAGKIKGIGIAKAATAAYRQIVFNVADPPFDNKKLRLAVIHALNKKEILQAAYYGFGDPADQKYPKGHTWYIEGVPSPHYDLAKSKMLLKESGYKGELIEATLPQGATVETAMTTIQAQLKKVGINVKLNVVDYGAHRDRIRRGEMTFDFMGSNFYADPAITYRTETLCELNLKKRTSNWSGYCNKDMDAQLEKMEIEQDPEKRKAILRMVITKKNQDVPIVPVGFVPRFFTFREHVKGFKTDDDGAFVWSGGGLTHAWIDNK